ncbi:MAG: DUF4124 domain-containing protein, partial [Brachymonas sp.]
FTGLCLMAVMTAAQAQWGWKEGGRTVFSDQPPPQGIAEKDIIRRPANSRPAAAPAATAAAESTASTTSTGTTTAAAPKLASKDPELEKRKNETKNKEAAAKKAEEEKFAAAKKENCERAKRSKANFDSGARISSTNSKGEREVMNDAQRAEESKRLQGVIASDCS